jgi:hypothetical protein
MTMIARELEQAWGASLQEPKNERILPQTLKEALGHSTNVIGINREEIRKDLQELSDWAEDCYLLISTFSDVSHAQGLAMHKIATICNKVKQLQKKY